MDPIIHHNITNKTLSTKSILFFSAIVIIAGIITGFVLNMFYSPTQKKTSTNTTTDNTQQTPKSAGVKDKSIFKDNTEGMMKKGGITGESEYHLERPGGESQNVYLTSSTVDLSQFLNKKVEVWGQTIHSEKAGWFMDVGAIEVK